MAIEPTTAEADLPDGKFWMENVATSEWFMQDEKNQEEKVYSEKTNMVKIFQEKEEVDVSFTKIGDAGQTLKGAKFALYDDEIEKYVSNITGDNGVVNFTKVRPGKYTMKEIETPTGHKGLPAEGIQVEIKADGSITWDTKWGEAGKFKNALKPFRLDLTKKGEPEDYLNGAVFKITGDDYDKEATTEDGKLNFTDLTAGVYTLEELVAPSGYKTLEGKFTLTIGKNGEVSLEYSADDIALDKGYTFDSELTAVSVTHNQINMTVNNEPIDPVLPATGGPGTSAFVAMAAMIVALAVGLWLFFRHTREMEVR